MSPYRRVVLPRGQGEVVQAAVVLKVLVPRGRRDPPVADDMPEPESC